LPEFTFERNGPWEEQIVFNIHVLPQVFCKGREACVESCIPRASPSWRLESISELTYLAHDTAG
jgi:hypothetical protein